MKVSCEDGCIHYEGGGFCKLSSFRLQSTWLECSLFKKELPQAIKATESPSHKVTAAEAFGNDCPNNSCS